VAIAPPVWTEQHHAVSVAAVGIGELPSPLVIETHERLDPAGAIEVGPLVAHAQMHFDDASADGLGIEDAGVALEMAGESTCRNSPRWPPSRPGVHRPMVEGPFLSRFTGHVPPPARARRRRPRQSELTWRPSKSVIHMCPGREARFVLPLRGEDTACDFPCL